MIDVLWHIGAALTYGLLFFLIGEAILLPTYWCVANIFPQTVITMNLIGISILKYGYLICCFISIIMIFIDTKVTPIANRKERLEEQRRKLNLHDRAS